jgi:hypothetical protein
MVECLLNLPGRFPLALLEHDVCGARDAFHKKEKHHYPIARVARQENAHEAGEFHSVSARLQNVR